MSVSFFLPLLLQSALLPFGVALAVLFAGRGGQRAPVLKGAAVLAGFLASFAFIHPQWSPMPEQALDWLPWVGIVALIGAMLVQNAQRRLLRILAHAALGAIAVLMVLEPVLGSIGHNRTLLIVAAAACAVALAWELFETRGPSAAPVALLIVSGGAGLALMIDASQSLGQLHGALAMAVAACVFLALAGRSRAFGSTAAGVALMLLAAMLASAHVYAEFSLVYVGLLAAGLASGLVAASSARGIVLGAIGAAIPVLAVLGLVLKVAQDSGGY